MLVKYYICVFATTREVGAENLGIKFNSRKGIGIHQPFFWASKDI
jgi:hypothetical protein